MYWGIRVRFRAKNPFGSPHLFTWVFLIRDGVVERTVDMNPPNDIDGILNQREFPPGTFPGEGPLRKSERIEENDAVNEEVKRFLDPTNIPKF